MTVSIDEQISCVQREVGLRRRIYPNRVMTGRMSKQRAEREIAAMEAVLETLEHQEVRERLV